MLPLGLVWCISDPCLLPPELNWNLRIILQPVLDQDAFALFHIENAPRCKSGRVGSVGGERGNVGGEHCWGLALHMPADLARSGLSGRKAKMMKSGETTEDRDGVS